MLVYATLDDMLKRFSEVELIQLTDVEGQAIDAAKVETKLEDAQATIDGYIGKVYKLPLRGCAAPASTPGGPTTYAVPPQLTRIACDLARFWLRDAVQEDSDVYRRYKAAMHELEALADGTVQLACRWGGSPGELVGADAQDGGAEVLFSFSPRAGDLDAYR